MRMCEYPGCVNKHSYKGYCSTHNNQFIRKGRMWAIRKGTKGPIPGGEVARRIRKLVSTTNFKGGRLIDRCGYVRLYVYDEGDPFKGRQVYEHRHVMEAHIGRELGTDEIVHHIDGNKTNNNISNLQIVTKAQNNHYRKWNNQVRKFWELANDVSG